MAAVPRWLPNAFSYLRIALVPAWVVFAEGANRAGERGSDLDPARTAALMTLITIGVSDVVDGQLARRFHLQTRAGALLDAVADKLAQCVLFTYLALRPGPAFAAIPLWFLTLLIVRDLLLLAGWSIVRHRRGFVAVVHRAHGKATSALLFAMLVVFSAGIGERVTWPLLVATAAVVATSTGLYVREGWRQIGMAPT